MHEYLVLHLPFLVVMIISKGIYIVMLIFEMQYLDGERGSGHLIFRAGTNVVVIVIHVTSDQSFHSIVNVFLCNTDTMTFFISSHLVYDLLYFISI